MKTLIILFTVLTSFAAELLYGSDYPEIAPQRWMKDFDALNYKPEVVEKVLYKNAIRVMNLKV